MAEKVGIPGRILRALGIGAVVASGLTAGGSSKLPDANPIVETTKSSEQNLDDLISLSDTLAKENQTPQELASTISTVVDKLISPVTLANGFNGQIQIWFGEPGSNQETYMVSASSKTIFAKDGTYTGSLDDLKNKIKSGTLSSFSMGINEPEKPFAGDLPTLLSDHGFQKKDTYRVYHNYSGNVNNGRVTTETDLSVMFSTLGDKNDYIMIPNGIGYVNPGRENEYLKFAPGQFSSVMSSLNLHN